MKTMTIPVDERNGRPKITNAMKAEHIGEYRIPIELGCNCDMDEKCPACHGTGEYTYWAQVPWDTCKEIYKRMATSAAAECV